MRATLPVHPVDLEPFRLGGPAERVGVATAIDTALRDSGFLLVSGHGVPAPVCDAVLDAFGEFFDLPLAEKRRWIVTDETANRGYTELGKEGLAYSRGEETPPDLFEAFNVGREDAIGPEYDRHRPFYAPNVWPDHPAGLRKTALEYERELRVVADQLLRAMALALELPEPWFVDRLERANLTLRAINYERAPGSPDPQPGQARMGAHSDYGVLTILLADDVPGLQVFHAGRWHDVAVPRGSFVCNLGDMLERWTNNRWTSTLHRVVPPRRDQAGRVRRRALARFLDCPPDLVVECIPTCAGPENPARYEP
ncbi:MAG: isopenicillin N synthase family oxygenase, partial [Actinomycetota bacterium]|nr:isopenicillin N synthase family oxygenase [Actinomycetota bacterium]